jgi:hypothetical protein
MKRYKSLFEDSKEILPKLYEIVFRIEEYTIHLYFESENDELKQYFSEAKTRGSISFDSVYSANKHGSHTTKGQDHLHIYAKNNEIAAVNIDGTGHDGHHGFKLPNKVYDGIIKNFPKFKSINKIIEEVELIMLITKYDFKTRKNIVPLFG